MSIVQRLLICAATLTAATTAADAKPRRVVILDFDGPRALADTGKNVVVQLLGGEYDLVSTKRWETARADASQRARAPEQQWKTASKSAGVDAVIEGWIQDEGRKKMLNVLVRDASDGHQYDPISIRIDTKGVSAANSKTLRANIDDIMTWISGPLSEGNPAPLPTAVMIGSKKAPVEQTARTTEEDDDADEAPKPKHKKRVKKQIEDVDEVSDTPAPAEKPAKADAPAPAPEVEDGGTTAAKPKEVAVAGEDDDFVKMFGPLSHETEVIVGKKATHVPHDSPRIAIDAGGYYQTRTITWNTTDPDANIQQPAGLTSKGIGVNAAFFPWPTKKKDGGLSGLGFTGSIYHSAGSTVVFDDQPMNEVDEYVVNQNGYELGVHYRAPVTGLISLDGNAFYGNQTYQFVDASPDFEAPDTSYQYLGVGGHVDLNITERAQVGFGARYFTVLTSGDLESTDFYGPSQASGFGLDASFVVPLPASLYLRGQVNYQRIKHELTGGGIITDEESITDGTDSQINASAAVGISF